MLQEAEPDIDAPQSFPAALTAYLSRCDGRDGPFGFALLSLLGDFIAALRCHDASFKGRKHPPLPLLSRSCDLARHLAGVLCSGALWWNPEKLDSNTCCYLSLACRLLAITLSGGMEGPAAPRFRALAKLLLKV